MDCLQINRWEFKLIIRFMRHSHWIMASQDQKMGVRNSWSLDWKSKQLKEFNALYKLNSKLHVRKLLIKFKIIIKISQSPPFASLWKLKSNLHFIGKPLAAWWRKHSDSKLDSGQWAAWFPYSLIVPLNRQGGGGDEKTLFCYTPWNSPCDSHCDNI